MGLFDFFKSDKNKNQQPIMQEPPDEAQLEFINEMTSNAERITGAYNEMLDGALDFTVNSLIALDELLEQFHENQKDIDEEMKSDVIAQAGSYVFEVARRNYGGKYFWYDQMNQPILVTGQPNFEISIIAFDKVKMRIENGKEDQLPFYFKGYEERVKQGKQGDKAMIN